MQNPAATLPNPTRCPVCGYVEATTVCRLCKTDKIGATPKSFAGMTRKNLRAFINGCHQAGDYGLQFEAACRENNSRPGLAA
jgi:hypothetical protein